MQLRLPKRVTLLRTEAEHTEICAGKDRVRRDRILELQSDKRKAQGVVSISDAILPMLANLRHVGLFQGIDRDKAMCEVIDNHRPTYYNPKGNFPGIEILPAMHMDVNEAIAIICFNGDERKFGLWDFDFTVTIPKLVAMLRPSLQTLADCNVRSKIVITGSTRGDGFRSWQERECFMRSVLPRGLAFVKCDPYSSNYFTRHREYKRRAPMCQYIIQGKPATKFMLKAA